MQVATQLLWGDESDLERVRASGPFDLIVGSDLLYAPHIFALHARLLGGSQEAKEAQLGVD